MKKLTSKIKSRSKKNEKPSRITNETVAEHRERILAGGRRFKYPVQYTKHRLVFTAVAIGLALLLVFVAVSWWQLYKAQTTDRFYYRLTRIVPLPVAEVDGEYVRYGDYLLNYKASETYLNTVEKADQAQYAGGGDVQSAYDFHKSQAMQNAVADAYARKVAGERNITVTDEQVDEAFSRTTQLSSDGSQISQEVIDRSSEQLFGLTPADNRAILRNSLLRKMIAYEVDAEANKKSDEIEAKLNKNKDASFDTLAKQYTKTDKQAVQVFASGWVKETNRDGGVTRAAADLEKGEVTGPIKPLSGDGYYFVRLVDKNSENEVSYEVLMVPLTAFQKQLEQLKSKDKIKYFIDVPEVQAQLQQAQ